MPQIAISDAIVGLADQLLPVQRRFAELGPEQRTAAVESARAMYEAQLKPAVSRISSEVDRTIIGAFSEAREACAKEDLEGFRIQRQVILKGLLNACYRGVKATLDVGNPEEAAAWLAYIQLMAKWDGSSHEAVVALKALKEGTTSLAAAKPVIVEGMLNWFTGQVKKEMEEVKFFLNKGDSFMIRLEAVEAQEYLRPIQPDLEAKLGKQQGTEVWKAVDQLLVVSSTGKQDGVEALAARVEELLN